MLGYYNDEALTKEAITATAKATGSRMNPSPFTAPPAAAASAALRRSTWGTGPSSRSQARKARQ